MDANVYQRARDIAFKIKERKEKGERVEQK